MKALLLVLLLSVPLAAQQPVREVPDVASWATAAVNPAIGVWRAVHAPDPMCRLSQLGLAELIGNGTVLLIKHFVTSQRPCAGCRADGMPSGHSMNSVIGLGSSRGWRIGVSIGLAVGTGGLRSAANRHTAPQVAVGLGIGVGADALSHLIVRCEPDP